MNNKHSPLHTIGLASGCLNASSSKPIKPRNNHQYSISYQNYHFTHLDHTLLDSSPSSSVNRKSYDFKLKFIIVGDGDVGKQEILDGLESDDTPSPESDFTTISSTPGVNYRSTTILLDGKRIKIQLWDASGQGRFGTIIRSYSRGAQGILLVYDITNKWSFASLDRWLQEVEEHAPGIPKLLIGNRLHLAFKRQVNVLSAENYAHKHSMSFFEISPLCNYNIKESFAELSRIVLKRHGMSNLWKHNSVLSLQELCCRAIVSRHTIYSIEQLPIPVSLKYCLKSYLSLASSYHPNNKKYIHSYKCGYSRNASCMDNASFKKKAKSLFSSMFKLNS